jgi:hypothetical protein
MSIFRTSKGTRYVVLTFGGHEVTRVWPHEPNQQVDPLLLVDLDCRYLGTGRESEIMPAEPGAYRCSVFLVGSGRQPGGDEQTASTSLLDQIVKATGNVPFRFEQTLWALWNAVYGVDLRPFGGDGERVPPEADDATWCAAAESCAEGGIFAWFSLRWEQRFDA